MAHLLVKNRRAVIATAAAVFVGVNAYDRQRQQNRNNNKSSFVSYCDAAVTKVAWPFDSKGLPTSLTPPGGSTSSLYLSGVGMRRKNLYITEVDVYLCGLNLSPVALKNVQILPKDALATDLAGAILKTNASKVTEKNPYRASVTLRFVRAVGKDKVVEAFNDAFKGCSTEAVASFTAALGTAVGKDGMKVDDTLVFYWSEHGGLTLAKNGAVCDSLKSPEVEQRLLQVYVDPSRAISQEFLKSIHDNVHKVLV